MAGDTLDLGPLIVQLDGMSDAAQEVAQLAADNLQDVLEQQFDAGVDPYGQTWAPLKDGSASNLTASGGMRSSARATAQGSLVTLTVDDPAGYHQHGTSRMTARQILPEDGELPPMYEEAVQAAADEVMNQKLAG